MTVNQIIDTFSGFNKEKSTIIEYENKKYSFHSFEEIDKYKDKEVDEVILNSINNEVIIHIFLKDSAF